MAENFLVDRLGQPIRLPPSDRNGTSNGHISSAKLFNLSQDTPYRRWRPQLLNDIARHLPSHHFRALLSDSRYIYSSGGGMVAGAVHKKADYTIGDAWTPQYSGDNADWRKIAEPIVWGMCRGIELRGLPYSWNRCAWLSSVCLDRDGDVFIVLTTDPDDGQPKLQFLEAHRIGTPPKGTNTVQDSGGIYAGRKILNGVVYDEFNRPIAYNVLPEVTSSTAATPYSFIPAASVIHIFDPRWFSQGRGIASVSFGILDWYDISEIRDAEKIAVKVNSSHAITEKNETGMQDPTSASIASRSASWNPAASKPQVEMLENGMIRYIKTNGSIESHRSDRPSQTWQGFMDHIARGGFLGMDWPIEVAWDMSSVGGAAVRAVVNQAQRSVNTRQACLRDPLTNAFLYVISALMDRGDLPFVEDWYKWTFTTPAKFSVDVGRDRQNMREDLAAGVVTLSKIVSDGGSDPESHLRERARDYKLAAEIAAEEGVPVEVIYNPLSAVQSFDPTMNDETNLEDAEPSDGQRSNSPDGEPIP